MMDMRMRYGTAVCFGNQLYKVKATTQFDVAAEDPRNHQYLTVTDDCSGNYKVNTTESKILRFEMLPVTVPRGYRSKEGMWWVIFVILRAASKKLTKYLQRKPLDSIFQVFTTIVCVEHRWARSVGCLQTGVVFIQGRFVWRGC